MLDEWLPVLIALVAGAGAILTYFLGVYTGSKRAADLLRAGTEFFGLVTPALEVGLRYVKAYRRTVTPMGNLLRHQDGVAGNHALAAARHRSLGQRYRKGAQQSRQATRAIRRSFRRSLPQVF